MLTDRSALLQAGSRAARAVMASIAAAGVAFALFLAGAGSVFGPINDVLVSISLVLLAWPVMGIRALVGHSAGAWFKVLTGLALVGLAIGATGQLLLVLGVISLETSFVTGGIGILPVLAWVLAIAVVALRTDALPGRLGWASAGLLVAIVAATVSSFFVGSFALWLLAIGELIVLEGWLWVLGWTLGTWPATIRDPVPAGASAGAPSAPVSAQG